MNTTQLKVGQTKEIKTIEHATGRFKVEVKKFEDARGRTLFMPEIKNMANGYEVGGRRPGAEKTFEEAKEKALKKAEEMKDRIEEIE